MQSASIDEPDQAQRPSGRPWGGFDAEVDGGGNARSGGGRDRADRFPIFGTGMRSGNFLVQFLRRKLAVVDAKYGKTEFERKNYALLGLMRKNVQAS